MSLADTAQWFSVDFSNSQKLVCRKTEIDGDQSVSLMAKMAIGEIKTKITIFEKARIYTVVGCSGDSCGVTITAESYKACVSMLGHAADFDKQLKRK